MSDSREISAFVASGVNGLGRTGVVSTMAVLVEKRDCALAGAYVLTAKRAVSVKILKKCIVEPSLINPRRKQNVKWECFCQLIKHQNAQNMCVMLK